MKCVGCGRLVNSANCPRFYIIYNELICFGCVFSLTAAFVRRQPHKLPKWLRAIN